MSLGYDIFEGNIYEGHTLIPFLEEMSCKFHLNKPVVIADAGLLSKENIKALESNEYEYILEARVKKQNERIKEKILAIKFTDGMTVSIKKIGQYSMDSKLFNCQSQEGLLQSQTRFR